MGSYGTIGLEFVLSVMLGLFGGRWLDGKLDTTPWLAVLGFGFGLAAGFRAIWRAYKEMQAITRQEEKEEGNPAPMYPKEEPAEEAGAIDDEPPASEKEAPESDKEPPARGAR